MTAVDDRPTTVADLPCGLSRVEFLRILDTCDWMAQRREREAYDAGYAAAEADMAAHWALLAGRVRDGADRVRGPIPEPAVRSQSDDAIWFTPTELATWAAA